MEREIKDSKKLIINKHIFYQYIKKLLSKGNSKTKNVLKKFEMKELRTFSVTLDTSAEEVFFSPFDFQFFKKKFNFY